MDIQKDVDEYKIVLCGDPERTVSSLGHCEADSLLFVT
jgi:hypothetical protein